MTQASHPHLSTGPRRVEKHGIDYIPANERNVVATQRFLDSSEPT